MHYRIRHETHYSYSRPVMLDPQMIRLRPRCDGAQRTIRHSQIISPKPQGTSRCTDIEGNTTSVVWFDEPTNMFSIICESEVETLRPNPFDFVITSVGAVALPARYDDADEAILTAYAVPREPKNGVHDFSSETLGMTGPGTVSFLCKLSRRIALDFKVVVRDEGPPRLASETLRAESGACRDLAVLFIEACRAQGLAARFASGYVGHAAPGGQHHLHAWAEVYLPGGGWRGFDPSAGVATDDAYIAVASSHDASGAAPVTGYFRGNDATTTLRTRIEVRKS